MNHIKKLIFLPAFGFFLTHGMGSVLLDENFSGTSLDTGVWASGGYLQMITVSGGSVTLANSGGNHSAFIRTLDDSFNFHQQSDFTFTIDLDSFDEPSWANAGQYANAELYFSVGPAINRENIVNANSAVTGFHFAFRWQPSGFDLRTRSSVGISGTGVSSVPSGVQVDLDATSYTITLQGATFNSTGTNTLTGNHGLDEFSEYYFMALHTMGGWTSSDPVSSGVINNIRITTFIEEIPPPAVTGLNAVAGDSFVSLSWDAVFGAEAYEIWRSVDGGSPSLLATVEANTYADSEVTNDIPYSYHIIATNEFGDSPQSATVEATPFIRTEWAEYKIFDGVWVDADDWIGILYVARAPWVYSPALGRWFYIPESLVTESGSWAYGSK